MFLSKHCSPHQQQELDGESCSANAAQLEVITSCHVRGRDRDAGRAVEGRWERDGLAA